MLLEPLRNARPRKGFLLGYGDGSKIGAYAVDRKRAGSIAEQQPAGGDKYLLSCARSTTVTSFSPPVPAWRFSINKDGSRPFRRHVKLASLDYARTTRLASHRAWFDLTGRFVVVPDKGLDQFISFSLMRTANLACDPPSSRPATARSAPWLFIRRGLMHIWSRLRFDYHRVSLGFRTRRAQAFPHTFDAAVDLHRRQYGRRNAARAIGKIPVRVEPRTRQHRDFLARPVKWMLDRGWESTQTTSRVSSASIRTEAISMRRTKTVTPLSSFASGETGALVPGQIIETGSPSCIAFATLETDHGDGVTRRCATRRIHPSSRRH